MVNTIILENPPTKDVNLNYGESDSTFKLTTTELPELKADEVKLKVLMLSNDPTQRNWIGANQNPARQYIPPVLKGDAVRSIGFAEVLDSKSSKYAKGDKVVGMLSWSEEVVVHESRITAKADPQVPNEWYLSVVGLTGLTAYFGLKEVGQFKEGQTVLVSAASGATGSMVVQLAKHLFKASKVIGVAGSEEKVKWVESLGADYCANYRDPDYLDKLDKYIGDDYVDVYYDNVGGEFLDFALSHTKRHGRIVACGAIAGYNDSSMLSVTKWFEVIANRLTIQGFIVFDFVTQFPGAINDLVGGVKAGKINASEGVSLFDYSKEANPLEKVPQTWHKLFTSEKPRGKLLTKIA